MPFLTSNLTTQIDIDASPEQVRKVFLDWEALPTWSKSFVASIETTSSPTTPGPDGPPEGSRLKVVLKGMTFTPVVEENSPQEFRWRGDLPIPGLFAGRHSFVFKQSTANPSGTTLVHSEAFKGGLAWMMDTSMGQSTKDGFEAFNKEIKARAEGIAKETSS